MKKKGIDYSRMWFDQPSLISKGTYKGFRLSYNPYRKVYYADAHVDHFSSKSLSGVKKMIDEQFFLIKP